MQALQEAVEKAEPESVDDLNAESQRDSERAEKAERAETEEARGHAVCFGAGICRRRAMHSVFWLCLCFSLCIFVLQERSITS